ncbi:MAG: DUF3891 family protein [Halobacteriales archaeon]
MIVAETGDHVRFVTQPDHADLAGRFADRWGNERFDRPEPYPEVMIAAYNHDVGWWEYDRGPHLGEDGRPIDFRGMPPGAWIDLYERGIDTVVEIDAYAGLLVSMHGVGLRNRRYGLSPSWPPTPPEYGAFVDRQEALQSRLLGELREGNRLSEADADLLSTVHESGDGTGHDSRLWTNYRLLQAWDTLSLAFCTTGSPPGFDEIRAVPNGGANGNETLSIDRVAPGEFQVTPYPLDTSPLAVSVPTRTVRKETFDGEDGLLRAYYRADREREAFTIRAGEQ